MRSKKLLSEIVKSAVSDAALHVIEESPKRTWSESDVTLRSGRCVPFGCKAHIKDIQKLIDDLMRTRDRQSLGSVTRARLTDAIRALRKELKSAQKKYGLKNPTQEEV